MTLQQEQEQKKIIAYCASCKRATNHVVLHKESDSWDDEEAQMWAENHLANNSMQWLQWIFF